MDVKDRQYKLKNALDTLRNDYDFMLIDCPPSLGLLTINALSAADGVVVPMQCEYFALEGLSQLTLTISQIKRLYNPRLELVGVVIAMYDGRLNLSVQVLEEIKKHFPGKLFTTPRCRAMYAFRRHPASVCRPSILTKTPKARPLTAILPPNL